MDKYYSIVAMFSHAYHTLILMCQRACDGEVIDMEEIKSSLCAVARLRAELLSIKEALGFTDKLAAYNDESDFAGFRLRHGVIEGDLGATYRVANDWVSKFLKGEMEPVFFETANYVFQAVTPNDIKAQRQQMAVAVA